MQGGELAYRLPSSSKPGLSLLVALAIAVFWNGIVSVFVGLTVHHFWIGQPNWFMVLFLTPFVLIGLVLLVVVLAALFHLLGSLLAGSVRVEIAAHPLVPGSSVDFLIEQSGLVALRDVKVTLHCKESATFTAGTNTRTATQETYLAEVLGPGESLVGGLRGTLNVPADAMHSFEAPHNKITWTLQVSGRILSVLPFGSDYLFIVRPGVRS